MPDGDSVEDLNLPVLHSEGDRRAEDGVASGEANKVLEGGGVTEKVEPPKKKEPPSKLFLLSECLPPVPAKLVSRILKGDFIDMAELLRDNLEAERRGTLQDSTSGASSSSSQVRTCREVPDLLSWVQVPRAGAEVVSVPNAHSQRGQEVWRSRLAHL
jgi:hypothetical protein